jgi:hypothetical protein
MAKFPTKADWDKAKGEWVKDFVCGCVYSIFDRTWLHLCEKHEKTAA